MSYWYREYPSIPAAAEFGISILRHQSIHNESIVVAPFLLAYTIYVGALTSDENTDLVFDTIWSRGYLNDMTYAGNGRKVMPEEFAIFWINCFLSSKWKLDSNNGSLIEDPLIHEKEMERRNSVHSNNTASRIKRLYHLNDFQDSTCIISLVSNFKAAWKTKFDPSETFEGTFYTSMNSSRSVNFLSIPGAVRKYSENDHFQMLSLPYDTEWYTNKYNKTISLSMNILLPKTRFGLAAALKKTNIWAFESLLTNSEGTYIKATIPKFDFDRHFNFERYFKSEGIEKLIAKLPPKEEKVVKAEWETYLRTGKNCPELQNQFVSAITIGMDENGSHTNDISPEFLSNSTSAHKGAYQKNMKPKKIIADHPFVFVVLYKEHPMFVGTHF